VTEAWWPLAQGKALLSYPAIARVAARLGRTPSQVLLRWHMQRGDVVFPRAKSPAWMRETPPPSSSGATISPG